jgi:hypothetical protein
MFPSLYKPASTKTVSPSLAATIAFFIDVNGFDLPTLIVFASAEIVTKKRNKKVMSCEIGFHVINVGMKILCFFVRLGNVIKLRNQFWQFFEK